MLLSREQIAATIPHGDSMCVLDEVIEVDNKVIRCLSRHHLDECNPLKEKNLGVWTLIEYGAQAAAVHKGLTDSDEGALAPSAKAAYIAQVKNIQVSEPTVVSDILTVKAECLVSDLSAAAYQITISANDKELLSGRVTLSLG